VQLGTLFLHLSQTENARRFWRRITADWTNRSISPATKNITAEYLQMLWDFISQHRFKHHRHRYGIREHKIAAVMSFGKNFAVWKTAGREIPWQTPDAPNNLIHVRLATGSVVE